MVGREACNPKKRNPELFLFHLKVGRGTKLLRPTKMEQPGFTCPYWSLCLVNLKLWWVGRESVISLTRGDPGLVSRLPVSRSPSLSHLSQAVPVYVKPHGQGHVTVTKSLVTFKLPSLYRIQSTLLRACLRPRWLRRGLSQHGDRTGIPCR